MFGLIVEGHFDSSHFLADYQGKCENLHGHRWHVEATLTSMALKASGDERDMVMDFSAAKAAVARACAELDHRLLVEEGTLSPETLEALEREGFSVLVLPFRTTAENLAFHLFSILKHEGLPVARVEVDETPHNRAFYEETPHSTRTLYTRYS